jgi:hypothetical protein
MDIKLVESYAKCGICGKLFASILNADGSILKKADCEGHVGAASHESYDDDDFEITYSPTVPNK